MFKVKRPAIIGMLIVLLVFTGYLNHQLTQQALRKTSKEYQKYESVEKAQYLNEEEETAEGGEDLDIEIVDSSETDKVANETGDEDKENMDEVINTSNEDIEEIISKEVSATSKNYFVEYRLSRDKLRASLVDRLSEIVNNSNTDTKMVAEAQEEIINIGRVAEQELQIEGLIKSKGFEDALVFLTDEDVKVIVSSEELSEQDMVKILEILKSETEYDMNDIKIMKKQ